MNPALSGDVSRNPFFIARAVRKEREKFVKTGHLKCIIRELGKVDFSFENIRNVMVVAEGSDCGHRAAEYGISIAKLVDAQITVVYVIDEVVLDIVSKGTKREDVELELRRAGGATMH